MRVKLGENGQMRHENVRYFVKMRTQPIYCDLPTANLAIKDQLPGFLWDEGRAWRNRIWQDQ
ncbi:MAG: hypothetical protein DI535_14415 [Citrobacter freundii]|nr:MAG: hypothetical protein DI535_14415 [Citrobacter freundii]